MKNLMRRLMPVLTAGIVGSSAVLALADQSAKQPSTQPSSVSDLQTQVDQLKAEVAQLKTQQQAQPNPQDVAQVIKDVLKDSDSHSQLLDSSSGITAGWDPANYRFFVQSDDGNFLFHPGVITQVRYAGSYDEDPHKWQSGFEIRRLKLYADGNLFGKDLTYKVQLQNSNGPSSSAAGGSISVEYAWGQLVLWHNVMGGDIAIRAGQFKNPVFHEEEAVGDNVQLMVERSLADNLVGGNASFLGGPYTQGVNLMYNGNACPVRESLLFTDGDGTANTDYTNNTSAATATIGSPATVNQQKFGAAYRLDYKVMGDWADNYDFTGKNSGKHDFLGIGGGIGFSQGDTRVTSVSTLTLGPPPTTTTTTVKSGNNTIRWDVDATYMLAQKLVIYGELLGDYVDFHGMVPTSYRFDNAQLIQAGYFLTPCCQLTGRVSVSEMDNRFKTGDESSFSEIGLGMNLFFGQNGSAGNHAKFSFDVNWLPDGSPSVGGLDYQSQPNGKNEVVFRSQLQFWF